MRLMKTQAQAYVVALVLLATLTWLDYATGYEIGLFIFYSIPVSLAAWYGTRAGGLLFALASGACWYVADRLSLHPYSNALLIYWETLIRLVSFVGTALTLSRIRRLIQERDDLLDVISHDLRAPPASLAGEALAPRKQARRADAGMAPATAIERSASRMETIIEAVVDSVRLESHQVLLQPIRLDLAAFLEELSADLGPHGLRLALPAGGGPFVVADPSRLERAVLVLLAIAADAAAPGHQAELKAEERSGWVTLCVQVADAWLAPADTAPALERFSRRHGPGLRGVQAIAAAHGGSVRVLPQGGGGALIQLALPSLRGRVHGRSHRQTIGAAPPGLLGSSPSATHPKA